MASLLVLASSSLGIGHSLLAVELRELNHDLATLLNLLLVVDLGLVDNVLDVLALLSCQCRRCSLAAKTKQALKAIMLSLIQEIDRENVPKRERLEEILVEVGMNDSSSCNEEIESLEQEIGDHASKKWTASP
ncbi:hypothetical protein OsI_11980 [Oryza sativa Indica Group]|uniref:Uncharacterized protein n=1 Tax=Oryza sativa subsp. indica TaxID=39946 RepID=B8AJS7_ORYSI|nr:hypothetical protein OsI_11980 [Oryza sativa Indica Group]